MHIRAAATMNVVIRPYEDHDLEEVARLWFESWQSTGLAVAKRATVAAMRSRIPRESASGWSVHLACRDDRLLGFHALKQEAGCLDQLFVSPLAQGQGIGHALLDFAKQQMSSGIWLRSAADNIRACRFYERAGFKRGQAGTHPNLGHTTIIYRWRS